MGVASIVFRLRNSMPVLRHHFIFKLLKTAGTEDSSEALRQSPHATEIRDQLIEWSQREDIKYFV